MNSLIVRDDSKLTVSFTEEAQKLKTSALESGALVGRVTNATEQEAAVRAQADLQRILGLAEKARKACKEPVLEFGRKIDATANAFREDLLAEMTRISTLVGSYQQREQARIRAEEQARNEKLLEIEREKAKALAKAKTESEVDAVQEKFNNKAAAMAPAPVEAPRAEGQRIASDWEVTITDIHELYRFHPNCVKLEPRLAEIKGLLNHGGTVRGITAKPIVKAGVRLAGPKVIDV
jgi:hypothetical protein